MKKLQVISYEELMDRQELAFLVDKDEKESSQFYKVMRIIMILSFLLPFIIAWFRAFGGDENPFSYFFYFIGVFILLSFSSLCAYIAYRRSLHKVKQDIRQQTKVVEKVHITRKQYMPHNRLFYFYIDSPNKLSIEVSESDYYNMEKGDELSIEYSKNAKFYLGYF